jgi:hypothetical protein
LERLAGIGQQILDRPGFAQGPIPGESYMPLHQVQSIARDLEKKNSCRKKRGVFFLTLSDAHDFGRLKGRVLRIRADTALGQYEVGPHRGILLDRLEITWPWYHQQAAHPSTCAQKKSESQRSSRSERGPSSSIVSAKTNSHIGCRSN